MDISTYDNKFYTIDNMDYDTRVTMAEEDRAQWVKNLSLSKYKTTIAYANIKEAKERREVRNKVLHAPKPKLILEMSSVERSEFRDKDPKGFEEQAKKEREIRKRNEEWYKKWKEESKERRMKEFIEEKEKILNKWAKLEEEFWLDTTLDKLKDAEEYRKIKLREQVNNL